MKKILTVLALLAVIPAVSACRTTVHDDKVVIDDNRHGNSNFCPPGQAKKGNC